MALFGDAEQGGNQFKDAVDVMLVNVMVKLKISPLHMQINFQSKLYQVWKT